MPQQRGYTFDKDLQLKDAGAVTASAGAQVGGSAKIQDLGSGRVEGAVVIDVLAISSGGADQKYELELQLSNDSGFASGIVVAAVVKLGNAATTGGSANSVAGRIEQWFTNEFQSTRYRYARMYHRIAGTTPSINYTAQIGKIDS